MIHGYGIGAGIGVGIGVRHTIIATGVGTHGIGAIHTIHIRMVGGAPVGTTRGTIRSIIPVSILIRDIIRDLDIMAEAIIDGLMARPEDGVRREHAPEETDDIAVRGASVAEVADMHRPVIAGRFRATTRAIEVEIAEELALGRIVPHLATKIPETHARTIAIVAHRIAVADFRREVVVAVAEEASVAEAAEAVADADNWRKIKIFRI